MNNKPVVLAINSTYDSVNDAVEKIFKRFPLNVTNKLVLVKPNMLGNFKPEKHVTTHPSLVSAVVKKLLSLNAKVVVGDNSGLQSILSEIRIAENTGITSASHGTFKIISNDTTEITIDPETKESIFISSIVKNCDLMISLPKMKTHMHTFITGAIKNSFGIVVGNQKQILHLKHRKRNDFAKTIAQIYNFRKPDLVIMDAIVAMEGNGPNSPDLRNVNRIFASEDGVALDHYIAGIMGMDPNKIPLINYCIDNKIGSNDYTIEGNDTIIKDFLLPATYYNQKINTSTFLENLIYKYVDKKSGKIRIEKNKCNKCLSCMKICPTKAIDISKHKIDSSKCILCYCCTEICKDHAITFPYTYNLAQKTILFLGKTRNK